MTPNRPKKHDRIDIHAAITRQIIAALEAGAGDFTLPWRRQHGPLQLPRNIITGKTYQGVNVLALWVAAEQRGFASPVWGTFKQWRDAGHPVRKGETAVSGVVYKDLTRREENPDTGETVDRKLAMARAFPLFNAAQVDNYPLPAPPPAIAPCTPATFEAHARVDALIAAAGVAIVYGGDRAFYAPGPDRVTMPDQDRFTGSATLTAAEAFEATRLHEMVHWTGHATRLDRRLDGRFGDQAYAFEELIAELGAAFLCAELGVTPVARADHAQYLAVWLAVLKSDTRAIFTAASQAQRAATYLMGFANPAATTNPA